MSIKSLKKQLMAAIAMVLVAAVALGSSTYAWFAANDTVTAEGMSVTAKSDVTFLMIKQGNATISEIRTSKLTTDNAVTNSADLYPTAHKSIANKADADAVTGENLANWYYKYSKDPAVYGGSGKESEEKTILNTDKGKYILANQFTLGLAQGSNQIDNIKVSASTLTTSGTGKAVKALILTDSAAVELDDTTTTSETVICNSLSGDATLNVWVYIYWDGNDGDVFTNNVANLKDTSFSVSFTGTPHVA